MNISKFIFCFAFMMALQNYTFAQDWVSYQSTEQINDLVDTGNKLFMATNAGLVVMDKNTLEKTIFNKGNSNLTTNHIQTITQAANGDLWIGTYEGMLGRFDEDDLIFKDFSFPEGDFNPNTFLLYDLEVAQNGDFWLGTSEGAFKKQGENWTQYNETIFEVPSADIWDIEILEDESIIFASNNIFELENSNWSNISETAGVFNYIGAEIFVTKAGDLFFAGDLDKVYKLTTGNEWEVFNLDDFADDLTNGSQVIGFSEDENGAVYFNTQNNGVFKFENNTWTQEENEQTLAFDNKTSYLYIDEENNHWLNSNIYLSVNKNGNITTTLISETTLEYDNIQNLHKGENGNMYFISSNNVAVVDENGNWSVLPFPTQAANFEYFNDILVLAENDIWLASNNGFYHYNGNDWTFTTLNNCHSFAIDSQGKIYLRANNSIQVIENGEANELDLTNSGVDYSSFSGHGVDAEDNLWIVSREENAIEKIASDGTFTTYVNTEYAAIDRPFGNVHFDVNGNVWVASYTYGAIKFDGENFTNPFDGNFDAIENIDVNSIASDVAGTLYFSHQYGVTALQNGEFQNLIIEDIPQNLSHEGNIEMDDKGTLWYANTRYGVFAFATETTTTSSNLNIENTSNLTIYPNPAIDNITLDFSSNENAVIHAFIYNNLGQLVANYNLGQFSKGNFQERINIQNLPNGFYTLQLKINQQASTKKLIIQSR